MASCHLGFLLTKMSLFLCELAKWKTKLKLRQSIALIYFCALLQISIHYKYLVFDQVCITLACVTLVALFFVFLD